MSATTYTATGSKSKTTTKLDARIFEVSVANHQLLQDAYLAYLANGRKNLAVTKNRGEVSGGGKKPWRQKGTGRARVGSSRNPVWRSGGVAFGPTGNENYSRRLNDKAKRQAVRQALSLAAADNKIVILEDLKLKNAKSAELSGLLKKVEVTRNILLIVTQKDNTLILASRNIPALVLVQSTYLNVYDVLNADSIVFTEAALQQTTEWLVRDFISVSTKTGETK